MTRPTYMPECAASTFRVITKVMAPLVLGRDLNSPRDVHKLLTGFRGNPFAKAGLDAACWALHAQELAEPLHQVFGGEPREIPTGEAIGIHSTVEELIEHIEIALANGFKRIKLKMAPGWDVEVLQKVREALPNAPLQVDCNGAYNLEDIEIFKAIDDLDLAMIEQPLFYRDLADHAILQRELKTPICLDESVTCLKDAETAIRIGACRIMNVKYGRVGDFTEAMAIHDLCVEREMPCWLGSMLESGVGMSHTLALATLPGFNLPASIAISGKYYQFDILKPGLEMSGPGVIIPAHQTGIGHRVDEGLVKSITLTELTVKP